MRYFFKLSIIFSLMVHTFVMSSELKNDLGDLKNYQINSDRMVSAGQPNKKHFRLLKESGVRHVVDLIPGDRSQEQQLMQSLNLNYQNIPVDWHNPSLDDFDTYVAFMNSSMSQDGKVLTHCKLNWRGAVFTYLYRVIELGDSEESAKKDMLAIWKPEGVWVSFIEEVIEKRMAR